MGCNLSKRNGSPWMKKKRKSSRWNTRLINLIVGKVKKIHLRKKESFEVNPKRLHHKLKRICLNHFQKKNIKIQS
jgi:hypothetical protein